MLTAAAVNNKMLNLPFIVNVVIRNGEEICRMDVPERIVCLVVVAVQLLVQ